MGKVPKNWDLKRLKYYFTQAQGGVWGEESIGNDNDMVCIRVADFDFESRRCDTSNLTMRNIPPHQHNRVLNKNDILLEKSGGGEQQPVGRTVLFNLPLRAVCSNFVERLVINKRYFPDFIAYLLYAVYANDWNIRAIKQTTGIQNLDVDFFLTEHVPCPELSIQKGIASFLDRETRKIDALIHRREKLIGLLKEKRQTIITQAVTKGLDPKAPMKDSGIPWLGKIPKHWPLLRLRFVMKLNPPKSELNSLADNTEVSFVPMNAVSENGQITTETTTKLGDVKQGYTYFQDKDVVLAKITPCFENGKGAFVQHLVNGIGFGTTEFHVLRAGNKILPPYLYLITTLPEFRNIGESEMRGAAGQKRVPEDFVNDFALGIPPIDQQKNILGSVYNKMLYIESLIQKNNRFIDLLKEKRQALISAAVTGKIDVRGEQ